MPIKSQSMPIKIAILDDYQDAVRKLDCFSLLADHEVKVFNNTVLGLGQVLRGQTLGIWGYGKIGRLLAGYGKAFGMKVLVWGRERSHTAALADGLDVAESREALFEQSDVLSLHLRLHDDTRGIVTA